MTAPSTQPIPGSILRISLTSANPARLAGFYQDALGFTPGPSFKADAALYGVEGQATIHRLHLGAQEIELVGFEQQGAPYPDAPTSHDALFQHLALVAPDIDAAHARLATHPGWTPITTDPGPVQLPDTSGNVRAFKFRDPEGHPLELLSFPVDQTPDAWSTPPDTDAPCIGIDHSAIVVADITRSIAFYTQHGFKLSAQSENHGSAQDALDGADYVSLSVRALSHARTTPHLELLGYHRPAVRPGLARPQNIACTRTVLLANSPDLLADPDGHTILLSTE